jgi:hypothetical protein
MGISRRTALTVVGLTTAVLGTTVMAAPAQAAWVPPSPGQFVSSTGVANGCTVTVSVTKTLLAGYEDEGEGVYITDTVSCPASADVHRLVHAMTVQWVNADGSYSTQSSGETGMIQSDSAPIAGTPQAGEFLPCSNPLAAGTHTWRAVARDVAKVQPSWRDPNPFVGRAGAIATITC